VRPQRAASSRALLAELEWRQAPQAAQELGVEESREPFRALQRPAQRQFQQRAQLRVWRLLPDWPREAQRAWSRPSKERQAPPGAEEPEWAGLQFQRELLRAARSSLLRLAVRQARRQVSPPAASSPRWPSPASPLPQLLPWRQVPENVCARGRRDDCRENWNASFSRLRRSPASTR